MRPESPTAVLKSTTTGARIRDARKAQGMSQKTLADRLGVHVKSITNWEGALTGISHENLTALAGVLNVSPDDLAAPEPQAPPVFDQAALAAMAADVADINTRLAAMENMLLELRAGVADLSVVEAAKRAQAAAFAERSPPSPALREAAPGTKRAPTRRKRPAP
jgi:transcriptional regulator with XRE-family HTH domain